MGDSPVCDDQLIFAGPVSPINGLLPPIRIEPAAAPPEKPSAPPLRGLRHSAHPVS